MAAISTHTHYACDSALCLCFVEIRRGQTEIILCMRPASDRWPHNATSSLIGWAHRQNNPWSGTGQLIVIFLVLGYWHCCKNQVI